VSKNKNLDFDYILKQIENGGIEVDKEVDDIVTNFSFTLNHHSLPAVNNIFEIDTNVLHECAAALLDLGFKVKTEEPGYFCTLEK